MPWCDVCSNSPCLCAIWSAIDSIALSTSQRDYLRRCAKHVASAPPDRLKRIGSGDDAPPPRTWNKMRPPTSEELKRLKRRK